MESLTMAFPRPHHAVLSLALLALATACLSTANRAPIPAPEVTLRLAAGGVETVELPFRNVNCKARVTFVASTADDWIRLPDPEIRDIALGQARPLRVAFDLSTAALGPRSGSLRITCPDCPKKCLHPTEVALTVNVEPPAPPAISWTLDLFHRLAQTGLPTRLARADDRETMRELTRRLPGFQDDLRTLARQAGVRPELRFAPTTDRLEPARLLPTRWPVPEAPPMLLKDADAWTVVTFEPVDGRPLPASFRIAQDDLSTPPPLFAYTVAPEHWSADASVRHDLCSLPETLRWVVTSLTYGDGVADRTAEKIDPDGWDACGGTGGGDGGAYGLDQPTRRTAPTRVVIAAGYFVDRQTRPGPVIAVPLLVMDH